MTKVKLNKHEVMLAIYAVNEAWMSGDEYMQGTFERLMTVLNEMEEQGLEEYVLENDPCNYVRKVAEASWIAMERAANEKTFEAYKALTQKTVGALM